MFRTASIKILASEGFNAAVLATMDFDAIANAARDLTNEGAEISPKALVERANSLLPPPNDPELYRLFFSTKNQMDAQSVDALTQYADYVAERASDLEQIAPKALQASSSLPDWISLLDRLARPYSYVLEAATSLHSRGVVPMRRTGALESLLQRPPEDNVALSGLFDKAFAIMEARAEAEKPALRPAYA